MGSVHFHIVPCSSLYFFSRSTGPFQRLVNVSHRVLICCTCHFQSCSLFFILASSVCKSLQCLTSTLTQGGGGGHLLRLPCSVVPRGGKNTASKHHWPGWERSQCLGHTGLPRSWPVCFPVYTAQAPGCSAGGLSKAGPGSHALPRSKLLRFRFSGTPQRRRLNWARVLCPSQVGAAQVTRCLGSALSPVVWYVPSPPRSQPLGFLGAQRERRLSRALCLLWRLDLWLRPSWWVSNVQDPRKTWLATGRLLTVS